MKGTELMWTMRNVTALALIAGLGACATPPEFADRGLDTVAMKATGQEIVAPPIHFQHRAIRSYVPAEDGSWAEVAGAQCDVVAGPYTASVTTPVRLVLPDLRPAAIPLTAVCRTGEFSGQATFDSMQGLHGPYPELAVGMKSGGGAS